MQMMRQGANSAVRFTTYTTLKQLVQGTARPGQTLPSAITFGIGGIAGLVTVYTTMPLEYVPLLLPSSGDLLIYFYFLCYLVLLKHECSL
jgi:solute carrier family 25 citrate transporter 1